MKLWKQVSSLSLKVLGDVCEEYIPFRTVSNGGLDPSSYRRRKRHKAVVTPRADGEDRKLSRQVDKLFIRGDNIVLISPPQPPNSFPP